MILPTSKIFEAEKSERSSIVTILLCEYRTSSNRHWKKGNYIFILDSDYAFQQHITDTGQRAFMT